jgi:hypothetical protein
VIHRSSQLFTPFSATPVSGYKGGISSLLTPQSHFRVAPYLSFVVLIYNVGWFPTNVMHSACTNDTAFTDKPLDPLSTSSASVDLGVGGRDAWRTHQNRLKNEDFNAKRRLVPGSVDLRNWGCSSIFGGSWNKRAARSLSATTSRWYMQLDFS